MCVYIPAISVIIYGRSLKLGTKFVTKIPKVKGFQITAENIANNSRIHVHMKVYMSCICQSLHKSISLFDCDLMQIEDNIKMSSVTWKLNTHQ